MTNNRRGGAASGRRSSFGLGQRLALLFALLAALVSALLTLHWFLALEPMLRAESESRARMLAEAQIHGIEQIFAATQSPAVLRDALRTALDGILLLRDHGTGTPFTQRIELRFDYELLPAPPGSLDLTSGAASCPDCFVARIPVYHPRDRLLIGVATWYSSAGFFEDLANAIRVRLLLASALMLLLIGAAWFGANRLLRRLRESEANLRAIFDAAPFPMLLHARGSPSLRQANGAAQRYLGLRDDGSGRLSSRSWRALRAAGLPAQSSAPREIRLPGPDGQPRWALVSRIPLRLSDVSGHLISLVDVSEIKAIQDELRLAALTDGLTGLFNRRYLFQKLAREVELARRDRRTFAIILFDLDHFKGINDRFGHRIGDQVLVRVAQTLRTCLREVDVAGRYGGEEFMVILPACRLADACEIAERIRRAIDDLTWPSPGLQVTVSGGVAEYDDCDVDALVEAADQRLYQAKGAGRNRMVRG